MGKLIERLLQNNNPFVKYMLKDAVKHNQFVYNQLVLLLNNAVQYFGELDYIDVKNESTKDRLKGKIMGDIRFFDQGNLISYFALFSGGKKGLRSNIVRVNAKSADTMINRRITELNELYEAIHHITPNFEGVQSNDDF